MNVSLTPELERFVNDKVDTGLYQTASEVVREALRLLKERDLEREHLRADVQAGLAQGMSGRAKSYDKVAGRRLGEQIKAEGRAKRAGRA
ncbi:MAG: type II toxin-antitoxin system ParD family antitoxin [Vicinamibacterales bacterium]